MITKTCGVINTETNILENIIAADIDIDLPHPGVFFIDLTSEEVRKSYGRFDKGWIYDPLTKSFTNPNNELISESIPESEEL